MSADAVLGGSGSGWFSWPSTGVSLRVDQDNVLRAIRLVLDEEERYRAKIEQIKSRILVFAPGGDQVSEMAARLLNERFYWAPDSYFGRCWQYADNLAALARQLAEAARTYGHTEEDVAALFPTKVGDRVDGDHYVA